MSAYLDKLVGVSITSITEDSEAKTNPENPKKYHAPVDVCGKIRNRYDIQVDEKVVKEVYKILFQTEKWENVSLNSVKQIMNEFDLKTGIYNFDNVPDNFLRYCKKQGLSLQRVVIKDIGYPKIIVDHYLGLAKETNRD